MSARSDDEDGWATLACSLDGGPAAMAAIGLVVLANDTVIEPEVRRFLPLPGVEVYASRIPMARDLTPASLAAMADSLPQAIELLLPDDRLDVVAFGCTSGSMIIGPDRIAGIVRSARPGVAVTDPVSASLTALSALGAARIALVTPYPASVNVMVEDYLSGKGVEIAARATFRQESDVTIARIDPRDIFNAAVEIGRNDVDAVFLSCTALRCSAIIEAVEQAIGKPVVTSNQALAWDALRKAGSRAAIPAKGRLLRDR
ncbi:Asp/Glu racemase [Mesorhizobium sp. CC13]|uniref:maleate cis-trans isomerase family protein n=1 Tax=Mesorhizobium sp. CC13 TaxID=3029194 RepID=UPI003266D635